MLLAGDIGGTKTRLAIFSPEQGPHIPLAEAVFASAHYDTLESIVHEFLGQAGISVRRAAFGIAGPVLSGHATCTNLPWVIRESRLQEVLGVESVSLLNDLQAIAYSVPFLRPEDVQLLKSGEAEPGGVIAIVAPGTGLGEAYITWHGGHHHAHASEGGHTDFGPTDAVQLRMLHYLLDHMDHVSYERVCSGKGLPNVYNYFKDTGFAPEPAWLTQQLVTARDPTPVIAQAALNHAQQPCELAVAALEMFVSILGAEAGNLALKVMATGGVYLGGGIPPRILPFLTGALFTQAFLSKGRFANVLIRIPVYVIVNHRAALLGAACFGLGL